MVNIYHDMTYSRRVIYLWIKMDGKPSWGRAAFTGNDKVIYKISYYIIQNKKIHT